MIQRSRVAATDAPALAQRKVPQISAGVEPLPIWQDTQHSKNWRLCQNIQLDKMSMGGDVLQGFQTMGPRFIFAVLSWRLDLRLYLQL